MAGMFLTRIIPAGDGLAISWPLASIIIFDLPVTSAWTMGLLIGIYMIVGGASLIAMGLYARSESPASNATFQRQA
jgi:hypothetical protein